MLNPPSLLGDIPASIPEELFQTLLEKPSLRIERILSHGHHSAEGQWYDQDEDEWVLLLQGQARLGFVDAEPVELKPGDYLLLPAHCQHRVEWTPADITTIWLAIHFRG